ncbi:MAG: hypothetical protein AB1391_04635 [Candidatus Micrarchaeota archaeon]
MAKRTGKTEIDVDNELSKQKDVQKSTISLIKKGDYSLKTPSIPTDKINISWLKSESKRKDNIPNISDNFHEVCEDFKIQWVKEMKKLQEEIKKKTD